LRRRRRGPVRTGLLGQRRIDQPFFSNPGIERALGDEPFRATRNDVLFLFNMIEPAPFTDGFPATRQSLCDQVFIGLVEREKGGPVFGLESEPSVELGSNWSVCLCMDANGAPYCLGAEGEVIRSGSCRGRPSIPTELRPLVRQRWQANPTRGSPCIVGKKTRDLYSEVDGGEVSTEAARADTNNLPRRDWRMRRPGYPRSQIPL
jgi:hypothetical protein